MLYKVCKYDRRRLVYTALLSDRELHMLLGELLLRHGVARTRPGVVQFGGWWCGSNAMIVRYSPAEKRS